MTAKQRTRSGDDRSSIRARSPPRQPSPGDGRGKVLEHGKDDAVALGMEAAVEAVENLLVGVDGEHRSGHRRRHPGEVPVVGAEVPHHVRTVLGEHLVQEVGLGPAVTGDVAALVGVPSSRSTGRGPSRGLHGGAQPAHVALDQLLLEPGGAELGAEVPGAVLVAALAPGGQGHVEQRRLVGSVTEREHRCHLLGGGSLGIAAQPRLVGDPHVGPQHQRVEVLAEELPVAHPDVARLERLERPDVDEHRPGADELHVVRRRVLQDHVLRQGGLEEVELQEGGVPQHGERPLVWVRDDRDPPVVGAHPAHPPGGAPAGVRTPAAGSVSTTLPRTSCSPKKRELLKASQASRFRLSSAR